MKKFSLLLIMSFCLTGKSNAQAWCPPGATWYYSFQNNFFLGVRSIEGGIEYNYSGDTVIMGNTCKKIRGTFRGRYNSVSTVTEMDWGTIYTFEKNHVLYMVNGNKTDTIVNYNAKVGDTWPRFDYCDKTGKKVTVTDTGHCVINSVSLKTLSLTTLVSYTHSGISYSYSPVITYTQMIYNGAGNYGGMIQDFCDEDRELVVDENEPYGKFICYRDNNFFYTGTGNCNFTGVAELAPPAGKTMIYPNPVGDHITINYRYGGPVTVVIIDLQGHCLLKKETVDNRVDVRFLSAGFYVIEVRNREGLIIREQFIKT